MLSLSFFGVIWKLFGNYLETIWKLFGNYLETIWKLFGNYLDAIERSSKDIFPIGRLRYFRANDWSLAFYTYSNERYEPCMIEGGNWECTLEQGIQAGLFVLSGFLNLLGGKELKL